MHLPAPPETPEWAKPVLFYGKPLVFNPKSHRYTWDGKHVPSVTTILSRLGKPQLVQWAANCAVDHIRQKAAEWPEDYRVSLGTLDNLLSEARVAHTVIRDTAGDVGTMVHDIARSLLANPGASFGGTDSPGFPEQARQALHALCSWIGAHRIQPIDLERKVFSADLMYAGTCDFYGYIDDEPAILDFKTGNGVYDEAWFQLAGYERALSEELGIAPLTHWVVHLGKNTGECKPYRRTPFETAAARAAWSSLVALDKAIRAMPKMERAA